MQQALSISEDQPPAPRRRIKLPYAPRIEQQAFHQAPARFKVLVAHRRLGKTVAAVNEGIRATVRCKLPDARGAYIAPFRNQAKRVAWSYCKQFTRDIPGVSYNEVELAVLFPNGAEFALYGADNAHALRGIYLDHAVLDEVAQMSPILWGQVIRPALSDRRGSATFIGTPQGKNTFWELYRDAAGLPDWQRFLFTVNETNIIHADELLALRREMTEDEFRQEYLCDFEAAIKGAYFGKEMRELEEDGRVCDVPWIPELDVDVAWDLGWNDATVLTYWQTTPAGFEHCIDCDAYQQTTWTDIVGALRQKPYMIGRHAWPPDVRKHEQGSGQSADEMLFELGVYGEILPKISHMDGVNAVRMMLRRARFDATRCAVLVEALKQYRAEYDEKGRVLRNSPVHDWTWDFADSTRYRATSPWRGDTGGDQGDPLRHLNDELTRAAV